MFANLLDTATENGVLKRMIGTGNKSINYKNSVCTFPDRKASKGMCENLIKILN